MTDKERIAELEAAIGALQDLIDRTWDGYFMRSPLGPTAEQALFTIWRDSPAISRKALRPPRRQ